MDNHVGDNNVEKRKMQRMKLSEKDIETEMKKLDEELDSLIMKGQTEDIMVIQDIESELKK